MKNKKICLIFLFSFTLALTGCNKKEDIQNTEVITDETGFGITLEEQKMCAEYAAGVLMKYNAGSNMRVLEGKNLEIKEAEEQVKKAQEEKRQQLADEFEANKKKDTESSKENNSGSTSGSSATSVSYIDDMSVVTGTDSFSIQYNGYEIAESYSGAEEDDFFAVDAVPGKSLLITKFAVTNIASQTETLDMHSVNGKYRMNLNGENFKAHQTLLLNDLTMYRDEMESGETVETVLVFEVPQESVSSIDKMELVITVGDEINTMLLRGETGSVSTIQKVEETTDLAEEYEAALLEEEAAFEEMDFEEESTGGNVTVVGSNNSISHQ